MVGDLHTLQVRYSSSSSVLGLRYCRGRKRRDSGLQFELVVIILILRFISLQHNQRMPLNNKRQYLQRTNPSVSDDLLIYSLMINDKPFSCDELRSVSKN